MVALTNVLQLPAPVVAALQHDEYDRGDCDYTVSELLLPPRVLALTRLHADEIEEDAADRIYALLGTAVHLILERTNGDFGETRLYMEVGGYRIGGKPDHFSLADGVLSDWKVASVWEWILGARPEREQQLNIYAELLRENGHAVTRVQNVMIFRDWSKRKARTEQDYPKRQVCVLDQPLWDSARVRGFVVERIGMHRAARTDLPACTAEERWARPPKYAVMQRGRIKALRVLDTEEAARAWRDINAPTPATSIEHRPGASVRCADGYCAAAPFCDQWKAIRDGA